MNKIQALMAMVSLVVYFFGMIGMAAWVENAPARFAAQQVQSDQTAISVQEVASR